ncbi:histamine H3 receptor-like isoform X2 [Denticeps clupeoides]|uniref:histamine H3 receptor-like isoform X2 n=1 Tax=Denticeps clupeoides TaxID=299321 RepID=UPI0010A54049|nr:histamine H3 receptor-like isoform X2 [Denticeps clupeoides]
MMLSSTCCASDAWQPVKAEALMQAGRGGPDPAIPHKAAEPTHTSPAVVMGGDRTAVNVSRELAERDSPHIRGSFLAGPAMAILVMLMMVTLVIVTVLGNALVIFAFKVDKSLRKQSNYFFLNLAISDFLVGAFCIPVYIPYIVSGRWMLGRALCKLWLVMDYLLCSASVFSIVLISYDRFLSVTRAVSYRARQGRATGAIVKMVAVWILAFLLYGPAILLWDLAAGHSRVPADECFAEFYYTCIYLNIRRRRLDTRDQRPGPEASGTVRGSRFSSFFTPGATILKKKNKMHTTSDEDEKGSLDSQMSSPPQGRTDSITVGGAQRSRLNRDRKIAKSLAVIVCVFAVCWAPYTLLMIIRAACRGHCVQHHWYEVSFWLLWLNSAINPFLYPVCHSSFRRAFTRILCPKRRFTHPPSDPT